MRLFAVVVLSTLLAACGDDGSSTRLADVARAHSRWTAQGLVLYTVEARILCFCPPGMNQWHELTVANDSIIAIRPVDASAPDVAMPAWFASVDEVFRRVLGWNASRRGNRFEAEFDSETGLPISVSLIASPNVVDGGALYEFRALKPGLFTRTSTRH